MNKLLMEERLPSTWKMGRRVLILNEKKADRKNDTYRPLCMLNALEKFLDHLLLAMLKGEIDESGGLSKEQHGFREGRSTISVLKKVKEIADEAYEGPYSARQLCALITLDVQNAFNSASWS